jgi:hypothetical protein
MKKITIQIRKNILIGFLCIVLGTLATSFIVNEVGAHGSHDIDPEEKKEVLLVLDNYLSAFNAKNLTAWEATYQFPHYRLASGKMSVLDHAGILDSAKVFGPLVQSGWNYSKWNHRNIIQASDDKVHVDTQFSRYKADGTLIGTYESLYVLTKENGKWGVKLRSSFAE